MLPDYDAIVLLHKKYAPSDAAFELVFTHCQIVERIAMSLIDARPELKIDRALISAGCLLHDIGVYKLYDDVEINRELYITHGIEGERILTSEHFDERLCRMASHHTGVGLRKADIVHQNLPLPHTDFTADSIEEELVMYADKFHSKTPRFNTTQSYANFVAKYGEDKIQKFMLMVEKFGEPDIASIAQEYEHPII
jgi:uncharacterized protein